MATLSELAKTVAAKAEAISKLLAEAGLPEPTYAESGKNAYEGSESEELRKARNELTNAAQDLSRLAMGPADHVYSLGWAGADAGNAAALANLKIPQRIPVGGTKTLKDLAAEIDIPEDLVARAIRFAIGNGVFTEPQPGVFAHSAASAKWAEDSKVQDIVRMTTAEVTSLVVKNGDYLLGLQQLKDKAPAAAANIAYPEYKDYFEYIQKNPEVTQRYVGYLDSRSALPRWSIDHILTMWDWGAVGSGTIVDVGGASGHTCIAIAKGFKQANFVSQDWNDASIEKGRALVAGDEDLSKRVKFAKHDFFTSQEVVADAYIFRTVLHDWSHEDSVKIIKALIPALKNGAHVLVSESLLPSPPAQRRTALDEKIVFIDDLAMLSAHNACERTLEQFQAIFKDASPNFEYAGASIGEKGAYFSLLDFVYKA